MIRSPIVMYPLVVVHLGNVLSFLGRVRSGTSLSPCSPLRCPSGRPVVLTLSPSSRAVFFIASNFDSPSSASELSQQSAQSALVAGCWRCGRRASFCCSFGSPGHCRQVLFVRKFFLLQDGQITRPIALTRRCAFSLVRSIPELAVGLSSLAGAACVFPSWSVVLGEHRCAGFSVLVVSPRKSIEASPELSSFARGVGGLNVDSRAIRTSETPR